MMSESGKHRTGSALRRKQDAEFFLSLDGKSLLKEGMDMAIVNDLNSGFEAIVWKLFSRFSGRSGKYDDAELKYA